MSVRQNYCVLLVLIMCTCTNISKTDKFNSPVTCPTGLDGRLLCSGVSSCNFLTGNCHCPIDE